MTVLPMPPREPSAAVRRVLARLQNVERKGATRWVATCPGPHDPPALLRISERSDRGVQLQCQASTPCHWTDVLAAIQLSADDARERPALVGWESGDPVERDLVAAVLAHPDDVVPLLEERGFKVEPNIVGALERTILQTFLALYIGGASFDPVLLARAVAATGVADLDTVRTAIVELHDEGYAVVEIPSRLAQLEKAAALRALARQVDKARALINDRGLTADQLLPELRALLDEQAPALGVASALPRAVRASEAPPPAPITWAIDDLWTAGDLGLLVGDGGSFKTTAAVHMAAAIAGGYPVFGTFRTERRPVLVVSAEDRDTVLFNRLDAFIAGQEWDAARVKENVHVIASEDITLSDPDWQRHLESEVSRIQPGFIVLDPLAELLGGDENSNTDVRPVVKFVRRLAARSGAATAMVHHLGKAGGDKRPLDRIRGASAVASAARAIYFFEFRDDGIVVDPLKLSRAPKPPRFVLTRHVESDPGNRAMWQRATLTHATARDHVESRAETFILTQLRAALEPMTTGDIKRAAHGISGVRAEDLAVALKILTARQLIAWQDGPRNSKLWRLADTSGADAFGPGVTGK